MEEVRVAVVEVDDVSDAVDEDEVVEPQLRPLPTTLNLESKTFLIKHSQLPGASSGKREGVLSATIWPSILDPKGRGFYGNHYGDCSPEVNHLQLTSSQQKRMPW